MKSLLSIGGLAAFALALAAAPASAQTRPAAAAASASAPAGRYTAPPAFRSVPPPVSPYHYNQPFPPPSFWSEATSKIWTREALETSYHTREVDLANAASRMIDSGRCDAAANYLETMGAPDMAARVPATCAAKRRGLI